MTKLKLLGVIGDFADGKISDEDLLAAVDEYSSALIAAKPIVSRSTEEKKLAALLKEALEILDKGSMFGIDWQSTGKYYAKAYAYMQKLGYCG